MLELLLTVGNDGGGILVAPPLLPTVNNTPTWWEGTRRANQLGRAQEAAELKAAYTQQARQQMG